MATAIKIENVSKLYRLGTVGTGTLSHDINRWWHRIRGKEDPYAKIGQVNDRTAKSSVASGQSSETAVAENGQLKTADSRASSPEYVWALKDINLEVEQGEILGIIGRNGAGKSTLLKLLSRVTAPTTGSIKTRGRIASLLEVGTGFHPELTGRENIYLNGAILGMKRHEVTAQLDEIVDFSGCAKYLDTPVKRYSSGMMVRLGFAVAAHLQCEILIVDEVLAVGDSDFQRKCVGKMGEVAQTGRTVLFVSHNMASIEALCPRSALLSTGKVLRSGITSDIVSDYLNADSVVSYNVDLSSHSNRLRGATPLFQRIRFLDSEGCQLSHLRLGDAFTVDLELRAPVEISKPEVGIHISNMKGQRVMTFHTQYQYGRTITLSRYLRLQCSTPDLRLMPGSYSVVVALASAHGVFDRIEPATIVEVLPSDVYQTGGLPLPKDGLVVPRANWNIGVER